MSIDYDLFVIDANNKYTTPEQLRDCVKDALENIDQRLTKQEKLMEVMVSHLDTQAKINERLARGTGLIPTAERMKEFDQDRFANDFEEEHGWCPDAGYEEIKSD